MPTNLEAFVYCWTDLGTNRLYVGVHKGTPDDGYVCSSKIMKEEYTKRPNDFSRQIIAQGTFSDCYALETALLRATGADKDQGFYNMHQNNGKFYLKGHMESSKKKIKDAHIGRKRPEFSDRWKENISSGVKESPNSQAHYFSMRTSEGREKNRISQKQSERHKESRNKLRGVSQGPCLAKGVPKKIETKEKMRQARLLYWKNKKLVQQCP
jgi:hypothetical protein